MISPIIVFIIATVVILLVLLPVASYAAGRARGFEDGFTKGRETGNHEGWLQRNQKCLEDEYHSRNRLGQFRPKSERMHHEST